MKLKLLFFAFSIGFSMVLQALDTTPPTITLKNGRYQKVQIASTFILQEPLSVSDNETDSADIVVISTWGYNGAVNSLIRKVYPLYIMASDLAGNKAYDTVWFNVDDTIPPVIDLNTPDVVCVKYRTPYNSVQPTASDNYYSSNQISLVKKSSDVDVNVIGTYTEVFEAIDGSGNKTTKTRIVQVKADCQTVGLDELNLVHISIFPNPGNGFVSVQGFTSADVISYHVIDANGVLVLNGILSDSIDISHLSSGVYCFQFFNGTERKTVLYLKL